MPDRPLQPQTSYTLRLDSSLKGLSGNSLASAATVEFTTSTVAGPEPVASVNVVPGSQTLGLGATVQFLAFPKDTAGNVLAGRHVTWSSSNALIASVSTDGIVSAVAGGTATITATCEGHTGNSVVTVNGPANPVASVTITPLTAEHRTGEVGYLRATLKDRDLKTLTDRSVAWTSSDENVVIVDDAGIYFTVRPGTATITAWSEGTTGTSVITVLPTPVPPVFGSLSITVSTSGEDLDPDGYSIGAGGGSDTNWPHARPIPRDGALLLDGMTPGEREVWLTDVDPNCQVDGAARTVTVAADQTTPVAFHVTCEPRSAMPGNDSLAGVWQAVKLEYFRDQALTLLYADVTTQNVSGTLIIGVGSGVETGWQLHTAGALPDDPNYGQWFMVYGGSLTATASMLTAQVDHYYHGGCSYWECSSPLAGNQRFTLSGDQLVLTSLQPTGVFDDFGDQYYWTRLTFRRVR